MRRVTLACGLFVAGLVIPVFGIEPAKVDERKPAAMERVDKAPNILVRAARDTEAAGFTKTDLPDGKSVYIAADATLKGADILGASTNDMVTMFNVKSGAQSAVTQGRLAVFVDGRLIAAPSATAQGDDIILLTGIPTTEAQALVKLLPAAKPAKPGPTLSVRARQSQIAPGGVLEVDAYLGYVDDLRAFQVAMDAITESGTPLAIESVVVDDTNSEFAFMGADQVKAVDVNRGRFVSALRMSTGVGLTKPAYTGTFYFKVPTDAKGVITVQIRTNVDTALRDSMANPINYKIGEPAKVTVMANATAQSK